MKIISIMLSFLLVSATVFSAEPNVSVREISSIPMNTRSTQKLKTSVSTIEIRDLKDNVICYGL